MTESRNPFPALLRVKNDDGHRRSANSTRPGQSRATTSLFAKPLHQRLKFCHFLRVLGDQVVLLGDIVSQVE
jgi:hypothetical protein